MSGKSIWLGLALGVCAAGAATTAVRSGGPRVVAASAGAGSGEAVSGTWTVEPARWKQEGHRQPMVQVTLRMRTAAGRSWDSSMPMAVEELRGLAAGQPDGPARFEIVRDAGTITAEGRFRRGEGAGHFTFAPSADYVRALQAMGYERLEDKVFSLALHDVSRAFIGELDALGYTRVALDDLVSMRIHGATAAYVRELLDLGYRRPDVEQLVSFRIHGVSADYVRALKELGYAQPDPDELVSLRIHGVRPEYVRELKELGYEPPPSLEELVSMRIHGASPEFVRALRELGYERVGVDDLVSMRIHGVSPEFVRRANQRSGRQLSVERLVSMRIHGTDDE
jgi:hypothetical protein